VAGVESALAGLAFGLSLIVAIGPQNTFVLVQGVRRRHVAVVVGTCVASDLLMIAAGVGGAGALLATRPAVGRVLTGAGIAFLLTYGALAVRRAVRPTAITVDAAPTQSRRAALLACLAFTWLNPGVYVDTVFLVGPVSHAHGTGRWDFALGSMAASIAWFLVLGYGARLLAPALGRPSAWRTLDAAVAGVMALSAVRLIAAL
jgi:L-lysine exporter family protein LysE/ArgO